ncbi:MAG: MerR family transcriptional regulator [Pseudomonadota bacterium]
MASAPPIEPHDQEGLYPIRHVCAETGVNDVTLRAWERRYGLIRPQRTPKGHRLYSNEDIALIKRILELLEQDIPVSQVHRVLADEPAETRSPPPPVLEPMGSAGTPGIAPHTQDPLAQALYRAVANLDIAELERTYDRLVMRHGWDGLHEHAFLEVYQHLREEARHEPGGEARLAVFAAWATAAFAEQLRSALRTCDGPFRPFLALGGGQQQVTATLLQLACARLGVGTLSIIEATTPEALDILVERQGAPALVIHASTQLLRSPELSRVQTILGRPGVPCFLAGSAAPELARMHHGRKSEILPDHPLHAAARLLGQAPGQAR